MNNSKIMNQLSLSQSNSNLPHSTTQYQYSPESTLSFYSAQQEQVDVEELQEYKSNISQAEADDVESRRYEVVGHTHANSSNSIPSFPHPSFIKSDSFSPSSSSSAMLFQRQRSLDHSLFSSSFSSKHSSPPLGMHRRPIANSAKVIKIQNGLSHSQYSLSGKRDLPVPDQILKNIREKELDKVMLGLGFPMLVGVAFSNNPLSMAIETRIAAVILALGAASIWNAILLRDIYSQNFIDILLMAGITSMFFSLFILVGCYVPLYFKSVPWLCGLFSLFPFILVLRYKMKANPDQNGQA